MSEVKGKLQTCDRCGETIFLKTVGDGDADGGFTRWNKFEEAPEGWARRYDISSLLCPKCNKEYENLLKWFMERNSIYKAIKPEIDASLGSDDKED